MLTMDKRDDNYDTLLQRRMYQLWLLDCLQDYSMIQFSNWSFSIISNNS